MNPTRQRQSGFSLIESLIAILVVAISALAMGALQLTSLRSTGSSLLRTIATQQAYDIADRARANLPAYRAGAYVGAGASHAACFAAGCTAQQQAEMDLYLWNQANASLLPSGQGHTVPKVQQPCCSRWSSGPPERTFLSPKPMSENGRAITSRTCRPHSHKTGVTA